MSETEEPVAPEEAPAEEEPATLAGADESKAEAYERIMNPTEEAAEEEADTEEE